MGTDRLIPMYLRVADTLKVRIREGVYRPGDLLPPSHELERAFKVSSITIRKALDLLAKENLVSSRRGVGTEVCPGEKDVMAVELTKNIRDWVYSASGRKFNLKPLVIEMGLVPPPTRISLILSLAPDEKIWRMTRTYYKGDQPMSYFVNYCRPELMEERIKKEEVEKRSFIEVFQEACHIKLAKIDQRLEATVANIDLAEILGINFGAPVFFMEHVYSSLKQEPVAVSHVYFRGDRYVYKSMIPLDSSIKAESE